MISKEKDVITTVFKENAKLTADLYYLIVILNKDPAERSYQGVRYLGAVRKSI